MPRRPENILEALFGGAGQGLQFAGQNLLPFRQQQLQNQRFDDEATALAAHRTQQAGFDERRVGLAEDQFARQQRLDEEARVAALNVPGKLPTASQVQGQFPGLIKQGLEADIALTGRKSQPTTTASATELSPSGVSLEFLRDVALQSIKAGDSPEGAVRNFLIMSGIDTTGNIPGIQNLSGFGDDAPPEDEGLLDRLFGLFGGGEDVQPDRQIAPQGISQAPRRTEGTIDQLERLFPPGTEEQGGVSQNVETWGRNRFGNQWDQATPEQKRKAAEKAGIR